MPSGNDHTQKIHYYHTHSTEHCVVIINGVVHTWTVDSTISLLF